MSQPTYDRLLIEQDALKSECIRMMDEIATLKRQAEDVARLRAALRQAKQELAEYHAGESMRKAALAAAGSASPGNTRTLQNAESTE